MTETILCTCGECVEAAADDDGDGEKFAEAEDVLNGRRKLYADAVNESHDSWKIVFNSKESFDTVLISFTL